MQHFLLVINSWMEGSLGIAVVGCFLWGIVSVLFSPCHLASIPLIIGFVAGQRHEVKGTEACGYAAAFSAGLFLSIASVGMFCSFLGRVMGNVPSFLGVPVGLILIWLGLDLMGVARCRVHGISLHEFPLQGHAGAFCIGGCYGLLSGACTFGFIAPILAVVTVQQRVVDGLVMITSFALGHCLPIFIAGSSAALTQRVVMAKGMKELTAWGRRLAGFLVIGVGGYFLLMAI